MSVSFSSFTPNNYPTNARALVDNNYIVSVTLPGTATNANSNAIDLQQIVPYPTTESIDLYVATTASGRGNSVNTLVVIQDSADNSTFANVATLNYLNVPQGAGSTAAASNYFKLPRGARQYVRIQAISPTNTGNVADATASLTFLF